jgi:hypothetical protein
MAKTGRRVGTRRGGNEKFILYFTGKNSREVTDWLLHKDPVP